MRMNFPPVLMAIGSAVLFGISTPIAKILLDSSDPWMLSGSLYCGAGVGLLVIYVVRRKTGAPVEAQLSRIDLPWLLAAILSGGIVGPILLMVGLSRVEASAAALLLTLEGVLTALVAWFAFKENFDRRIALGMLSIVIGAIVLNWQPQIALADLLGPAAIAGACLAWAIDNNLTRKVSLSDPVQIAMIKGLIAGPVSLGIGYLTGAAFPSVQTIVLAGMTGVLGYGISLVLFVLALRHLGTARTGAYFSVAPFVGALVAVPLFGETVTAQMLIAGLLMAAGVWLHMTERHEHYHEHEDLLHEHRHTHDIHHDHQHDGQVATAMSHTHWHRHRALKHSHLHVPDSHHRHSHK